MIDDIVSYGGTLAYSADALKEYGTKDIYAYASHTENSILDKEKSTLLKRLEDGTVKRLFTTNSIYRGENGIGISEYKDRIKYVPNIKNSGAQISRNNGILHSSGKFIAFLDDDDDWDSKSWAYR